MNLEKIFSFSDKKIDDILLIREYKHPYFILQNGNLLDFVKIKSKNLSSATNDEIQYDVLSFTRLYKTYADDLKIIGINFPTNTKSGQAYLKHKIKNCGNALFKELLIEKLHQLEWIEKHRTDREYYLMFYSSDELKYKDNLGVIEKSLASLISPLDEEKKMQILFKMNNKNTSIFV